MSTRINKYIAESGYCSRRKADQLVAENRVKINGKQAKNGDQVSATDKITIDNNPIKPASNKIYIAFHKPFGAITTTNPASENNVLSYIDIKERIFPVGRLDVESSGLLILTNDGDLTNYITKTQNQIEKEYLVTLNKSITDEQILQLQNGIQLEDKKTLPAKIQKISSHQIKIILIQGLNRQIRRMCEKLGFEVKILKRIRIGTLKLGDLARGKYRHLTPTEIASLKQE